MYVARYESLFYQFIFYSKLHPNRVETGFKVTIQINSENRLKTIIPLLL